MLMQPTKPRTLVIYVTGNNPKLGPVFSRKIFTEADFVQVTIYTRDEGEALPILSNLAHVMKDIDNIPDTSRSFLNLSS